jgi:hypothetical protein
MVLVRICNAVRAISSKAKNIEIIEKIRPLAISVEAFQGLSQNRIITHVANVVFTKEFDNKIYTQCIYNKHYLQSAK